MTVLTNDICIQSQAFDLAKRIGAGASDILERSVEIARQRHGQSVIPQDVRQAFEAIIAEIAVAFEAVGNGTLTEFEFSDEEFAQLTRRSSSVSDAVNTEDDDL